MTPARPGLVLALDGLEVWEHELTPLLAYAEQVDSRLGRNARITYALEQHLLPLKLAQRAFAAERAQQRARAQAFANVVGNGGYPELAARGKVLAKDWNDRPHMRHELPPTVAAFAFDADRIGHVSPILETPQGFCLVSTFRIEPGITRTLDRAEAFQVPFYTHTAQEFGTWLEQARARLAEETAWVHPDYRSALPAWIKVP